MANITFTKVYECAAGDHLRLAITGDVPAQDIGIYLPDLTGSITDEEKQAFLKVLLRVARIGRTQTQIKNALTNGYTITI
jgi:hypothetical protein